jgi:hypothetical protein
VDRNHGLGSSLYLAAMAAIALVSALLLPETCWRPDLAVRALLS